MDKIQQSEELIHWIDQKIDGLEFTYDDKKKIVGGCLDVALEHQKAIVLLVANKCYGSAFSLIRVIFETWVRSLWLNYCATENDIEKYKDNKLDKKFYEMIEEMENIEGYRGCIISRLKLARWKAMNSFTHSGNSQIERRFKGSNIQPNYDREEIDEVIDFANVIGLLCCFEISLLVNEEQFTSELVEKIKEI